MPAPTVKISGHFSRTVTSIGGSARRQAIAAVSPPIPAPMIIILSLLSMMLGHCMVRNVTDEASKGDQKQGKEG